MSKQINIREELNRRDMNSCTTDFVNMYECANLSLDKKKSLVKLLSENVSNKRLSKFFEDIDYSTDDYLFKPYWYFTRHGVGPGSVPNYIHVLGVVDADNGSYFASDKVIQTKDLEEYELKERTPNADDIDEKVRINIQNWLEDPIEENLSNKKLKEALSATKLEQEIRNTVRKMFASLDDEDYNDLVGDYLVVEIKEENGRTKVEVRAELAYTQMHRLANRLDEIIQKYDDSAYFDFEDSGIINAYVNKSFEESLKEEYGHYKDEPYCEEIADALENGIWVGETYNGTSWELTINGYSSDEFSPSFADYLAEEVSYPVRDGHLAYLGIEMILYKSSMESIFGYDELDELIPDLIKLDLDRETIDEWLSSSNPDAELDFHYDFDIAFDVDEWEENNREDVGLPTEVTYDFYSLVDDDVDINSDDYNLDDVIADRLSDDYGYTHFGFEYDVNAESGDVYVYDIKWDISESLKEDYTHFTYKSGANPYIAKTDKEARRILNKYKGKVKETKKGFYEIDDTKEDSFITESVGDLLSNEEFVKAYKEEGFEGAEIILDWDKKQHTFEEWEELLLNTYLDLEQDLLAQGDFETVKHNRDTYINRIIGDKVLSEVEAQAEYVDTSDILPPKPNYLGDE